MKPAAFAYHRPNSVAEAVEVLAATGGKVLAGGQSLVPLLNMRLAAPADIVDINGLEAELGHLDGGRIGALVRHTAVERSPVVPGLLREATRHVAHPTIRNRGTCVGSLAHADPAAEIPAVLLALGGTVTVASASKRRVVAAADLFVGPLATSLAPDELIVEATFPDPGPGTAWMETSRRSGDYALCGIGLVAEGASARAAYIGVGPVPALVDLTPAGGDWRAAGELAREALSPEGDIHASADYRRHLIGVLTERAGRLAAERQHG
jgi:carbon-monoxide dehydrogenase medium subunit